MISVKSIFGDLNPHGFSVIRTTPAGNDWFVAIDEECMLPIFESESAAEAQQVAAWHMQVRDLGFIAHNILDRKGLISRLYVGEDLTKSDDGLDLVVADIVKATTNVVQSDGFKATAQDFNPDWKDWVRFCENADAMEGVSGKDCVVLEFEALIPKTAQPEIGDDDTREVCIMLTFDKSNRFAASSGRGVEVRVLNTVAEFGDEHRLGEIFHEFRSSSMQQSAILDERDIAEENDFYTRSMPLYLQHAQNDPEKRNRVIALEGGKALEKLAATRPWMVEKDAAGNPMPLRIDKASTYRDVDEVQATAQAEWISSIVIRDQLTECVRKIAIAAQQRQDLQREQVMDDGKQFHKVARILSADLEVMYDKTTPNTLGTRDWLCYRLWVEGELVLDVHPSNPVQYAARSCSLSPVRGSMDRYAPVLTDEQVGELLSLALTPIDAAGDGDPEGDKLPQRVKDFLVSLFAEELGSEAISLEQGEAILQDGVVIQLEKSDDDEKELESDAP